MLVCLQQGGWVPVGARPWARAPTPPPPPLPPSRVPAGSPPYYDLQPMSALYNIVQVPIYSRTIPKQSIPNYVDLSTSARCVSLGALAPRPRAPEQSVAPPPLSPSPCSLTHPPTHPHIHPGTPLPPPPPPCPLRTPTPRCPPTSRAAFKTSFCSAFKRTLQLAPQPRTCCSTPGLPTTGAR